LPETQFATLVERMMIPSTKLAHNTRFLVADQSIMEILVMLPIETEKSPKAIFSMYDKIIK